MIQWFLKNPLTVNPLYPENWSVEYHGLSITNEVAYSGYEDLGIEYLFPTEGQTQTYHQVFTVALMGEM